MLKSVSHYKYVFIVVFIAIVGVSLYAFNMQNRAAQSTDNPPESLIASDKNMLTPTDKSELKTEPMVTPPKASQEVTTAENQMPAAATPAYDAACTNLKALYESERNRLLSIENATHQTTQQQLLDKFSNLGLSFSNAYKNTQASELRRHTAMLEQIEQLYLKQMKTISC